MTKLYLLLVAIIGLCLTSCQSDFEQNVLESDISDLANRTLSSKELSQQAFLHTMDKTKFSKSCNLIISALNSVESNDSAYVEAMGKALYDKNEVDSKFISTLANRLNSTLSEKIDYSNIEAYSKQVNSAMKAANLTPQNYTDTKKILQTAVCSFVYWKAIYNNE